MFSTENMQLMDVSIKENWQLLVEMIFKEFKAFHKTKL